MKLLITSSIFKKWQIQAKLRVHFTHMNLAKFKENIRNIAMLSYFVKAVLN